jgi:hypothetical protein
VLIRTYERIDCILWVFENRMLEVCVGLQKGEIIGNFTLSHILPPKLIEIRRVVIHF